MKFIISSIQSLTLQPTMAWLDEAVHNVTYIENMLHIVPDWAVFTRDKDPGHAVTDKNGPGEDYVLKRYLNKHR